MMKVFFYHPDNPAEIEGPAKPGQIEFGPLKNGSGRIQARGVYEQAPSPFPWVKVDPDDPDGEGIEHPADYNGDTHEARALPPVVDPDDPNQVKIGWEIVLKAKPPSRERLRGHLSGQPPNVRASFAMATAAVNYLLDHDDKEAARIVIQNTKVPPELERVKQDILSELDSEP